MDLKKLSIDDIKKLFDTFGGVWGEVNLFGIRNDAEQAKDLFNDVIGVAAGDFFKLYQGTTDPGAWWTENPVTAAGVTGAAHLCEGYHKNAWQVGVHAKGSLFAHQALVQTGNAVKIWRDKDKDYEKDAGDPVQTGYFGINIHRAGLDDPYRIGRYSAGCQVVRNHAEFLELMKIVKASEAYRDRGGQAKFSYLLINTKSL